MTAARVRIDRNVLVVPTLVGCGGWTAASFDSALRELRRRSSENEFTALDGALAADALGRLVRSIKESA